MFFIVIILFAILAIVLAVVSFRIFKEWKKDNLRLSAFQATMFTLGIILIVTSTVILLFHIEPSLKKTNYIFDYTEIHHVTDGLRFPNAFTFILQGGGFFLIILGFAKKN